MNNGGYFQFFWNSSRKFALIIVESLQRVGLNEFAEITTRAIATLNTRELTIAAVEEAIQKEDKARNNTFDALSREYYSFPPPYQRLLEFIELHQDQIQLIKTDDYPRRPAKRDPKSAPIKIFKGRTAPGTGPARPNSQ